MTPTELMSPRYIVTQLYPNAPFSMREIIHQYNVPGWKLSDWPNIFEPLHWYKYRKDSELPQYLKFVWNNNEVQQIEKVEEWIQYKSTEKDIDPTIVGFVYLFNGQRCRMALNDAVKFTTETGWFPANEQEHNEFHNKTT